MRLCAGALPDLLPTEPAGERDQSLLLFSQCDWPGGLLLRLFYSRGVQSGILYDHISGVFGARAFGVDAMEMAAQARLLGRNRRIWMLLFLAVKRHVCRGRKIIAVSELDF